VSRASADSPPRPPLRANILAFVLGSLVTLVAATIAGTAYGMIMFAHGSDATFGYLTESICARTCAGCRGPMVRRGGTRVVQGGGRGSPSKMYCQPPHGSLDGASDIALYEVKTGAELPRLAAYGLVAPPLWLLSFLLVRWRIIRNLERPTHQR
jgi:hypothetical protein